MCFIGLSHSYCHLSGILTQGASILNTKVDVDYRDDGDEEAGGVKLPDGHRVRYTKTDDNEDHGRGLGTSKFRKNTGPSTHLKQQCQTASDVTGSVNPYATFVCPVCGDIFGSTLPLYLFYRHL
jgi:hypothetical protein